MSLNTALLDVFDLYTLSSKSKLISVGGNGRPNESLNTMAIDDGRVLVNSCDVHESDTSAASSNSVSRNNGEYNEWVIGANSTNEILPINKTTLT